MVNASTPLFVNASLSGQWVAGQLYLIDVEAGRHYLLAGPVGFYVAERSKGRAAEAPTTAQLRELTAAGILTTTAPKPGRSAEIEGIARKDVAQATSDAAILETGDIEMRLVASIGETSFTSVEMLP